MKKTYSKPDILFENLSLSQNVAASCEYKIGSQALYLTGIGFAFTNKENCDFEVDLSLGGDGEYNGICYHVYSSDLNIFSS